MQSIVDPVFAHCGVYLISSPFAHASISSAEVLAEKRCPSSYVAVPAADFRAESLLSNSLLAEVQNATRILPEKSQLSIKVLIIRGA